MDKDTINESLEKVARLHSETHKSKVTFSYGEGWLCNKCDKDYSSYEWNRSEETHKYFLKGMRLN